MDLYNRNTNLTDFVVGTCHEASTMPLSGSSCSPPPMRRSSSSHASHTNRYPRNAYDGISLSRRRAMMARNPLVACKLSTDSSSVRPSRAHSTLAKESMKDDADDLHQPGPSRQTLAQTRPKIPVRLVVLITPEDHAADKVVFTEERNLIAHDLAAQFIGLR